MHSRFRYLMEANGQIFSGPHTPSTNRYMVERTGCTAILYKVVAKEKNPRFFQESKFTNLNEPFWLIHP